MSITRHHAEWLSLVEVSGPFLSLPVLLRTFSEGLDAHDAELKKRTDLAHAEWRDSQGNGRPDGAKHRAWIDFVLREVLEHDRTVVLEGPAIPDGIHAELLRYHETLRPDLVLANPAGRDDAGRPRLLVQVVPSRQPLDRVLGEHRWAASPAQRMQELLRTTGVLLGLVTNGEHWMLVYAPPDDPTGYASWYASLWGEEPLTFRAFRSLLGAHRLFGVTDAETLEGMLGKSSHDQQDLTDQLGFQVRRAVEVLIQTLDRVDHDRGRNLLRDVTEAEVYEAALTVMMRLVFLLCAEERAMLPLGDPVYDQHFAVSTLSAQLREAADQYGEEILEHRKDAWCRLLATFRGVYGGIHHDRLYLPAYGGRLFNPDRFAFLEGRPKGSLWRDTPANPLPVDNRTVLHLLEALQVLQVRVPGGGGAEARRLSFRALDIEQIGHVYEGLLDHTAVRATEPVLGLAGTKEHEPEVPLATLEGQHGRGVADLAGFLKIETGRSESAITRALGQALDHIREGRLHAVCAHDRALLERVLPFAHLVRDNSFGYPLVIPRGSLYVTEGTDRRSSGTHYTPRSLTEPIVRHALDPLVFEGPAEG